MDQQQSPTPKRKIRWGNWIAWTIGALFWVFVCSAFVRTAVDLVTPG